MSKNNVVKVRAPEKTHVKIVHGGEFTHTIVASSKRNLFSNILMEVFNRIIEKKFGKKAICWDWYKADVGWEDFLMDNSEDKVINISIMMSIEKDITEQVVRQFKICGGVIGIFDEKGAGTYYVVRELLK